MYPLNSPLIRAKMNRGLLRYPNGVLITGAFGCGVHGLLFAKGVYTTFFLRKGSANPSYLKTLFVWSLYLNIEQEAI